MTVIRKWVEGFFPNPETRPLYLFAMAGCVISSHFSDMARRTSTLAHIALSPTLDNSFKQAWVNEDMPEEELYLAELPHLSRQVIVVAQYYFTFHLSLYTAATQLLTYTGKVGVVAQPILEKLASSLLAQKLSQARIIVITPLVFKLLHMVLIKVDPLGKNRHITPFKTMIGKASSCFEFLWHVRFSMISLALSTTPYISLGIAAFNLGLKFVPNNTSFSILTTQVLTLIPWIVSQIISFDSWPTSSLTGGLEGMRHALTASSEPYDIPKLTNLFDKAKSLCNKSNLTIQEIEQFEDEIKIEVQKKTIDQHFADTILQLLPNEI